ncbi:MAG: DsbA family protein [Woeseiaceae bacterium]|nr:DsbA family protein [Woeseiaceae bacterium]
MKRKLRSIFLTVILDHRYLRLKRILVDLRRRLTFKPRVAHVFLQIDDPYCYLLSHYLDPVANRYKKVRFRYYLGQALRGEYMPQPGMLAEYAVEDCKLLAQELGVPFLDVGEAPAVEYRRPLLDYLAEEHDDEDFPKLFAKALAVYWRGDAEGAAKLIGRARGEQDSTNVLVGKNQLLMRKMGHYNCATIFYGGEWYWGIDRLSYLVQRLEEEGLNRFQEPIPEVQSLEQAMQLNLPATVPAKAGSLPTLEMFHSFRSPYSYISLTRAFKIADAFGLKLEVRPVLPMVMRGLSVPKAKLLYIVRDASREARRLEVPFGKFADPVGVGTERCIAAFYYAKAQGKERDFLYTAGQAIWSRAVDVAEDEGMQIVAKRCGLFWPELQEAMAKDDWREKAEANREALTELGLWGVPCFKIGELALWGQDRDWLLARKIEDMCHAGEGIMV